MGKIRREEEKKMKADLGSQKRRSKSILVSGRKDGVSSREGLRKEVEKGRRKAVQKNGRLKYELRYERKEDKRLTKDLNSMKELEVSRYVPKNKERSDLDYLDQSPFDLKKSRKKERDAVLDEVKRRLSKKGKRSNFENVTEWKESVVRVGTGYRVRKDEKNPRKRRFDVGYSDLKSYTRKEGRESSVDSSNMGRTVFGKGENARVKVMNAVCAMEKRRPASEYTGSGILRKSRVGKIKLKPTKPSGKE